MHESPPARRARLALAAAFVLLPASAGADDAQLFSARVAPNVMLAMDDSGSMTETMWHPAFDITDWPFYRADDATEICDVIPDDFDDDVDDYDDDNDDHVRIDCGSYCRVELTHGSPYSSDWVSTYDSSDSHSHPDDGYVERAFCGETRRLYHDGRLEDDDRETWYTHEYVEWLFSLDPADTTTTYGPDAQTAAEILAEIYDSANGTRYIDGTTFGRFQRSRMTAAKEVAIEVMYRTNSNCPPHAGDCGSYEDRVRFGISQFRGSDGGFVSAEPANYTTGKSDLEDAVNDLAPGGSTPLGETLFQLYTFFMHRTNASDRPLGVDGSTRFPAYTYRLSDGDHTATQSEIPDDPFAADCQRQFIIMITDGVPNDDDFTTSGDETAGFGDFRAKLVGDYGPDLASEIDWDQGAPPWTPTTPKKEEGSPPWRSSTGAGYLDDIALFMQEHDLRGDIQGTQVVDVYTVGFTTSGAVNVLLEKTARNGQGEFFAVSQAEDLTQGLVTSIASIYGKSQSFAASTVPASRTTDGDSFYSSYFVPSDTSPFWEGHLKSFQFTPVGDILDADGFCAVGVLADDLPPCDTAGALRTDATGFWDAAEEIPDPDLRSLYFGAGDRILFTLPPEWEDFEITASDLNLTASDLTLQPYDQASDLDELASLIVNHLRGCEFGTDCTPRTTSGGEKALLGDIFHANPAVVGSPNAPINEPSYRDFAIAHRQRTRVIYAGANDGFLHAFNAGDWRTLESDGFTPLIPPRHDRGSGVELFGFMPAEIRQTVKQLPLSPGTPHAYYSVDGSPIAADVWFYRDFATAGTPLQPLLTQDDKTPDQWRTVLIGGLRQGGRSYYALDVTSPGSSEYPGYIWEFPCDEPDCDSGSNESSDAMRPLMGETWSEPVITRVRVAAEGGTDPRGYERWVAIFGAGYDPKGDPNHADYDWDPSAAGFEPRGRAIFMVDIATGQVLAMKEFSDTPTTISGAQIGFPEMRYGFASAPAVFDLNFDGFADVIYIGDLGGNVWKWVVNDIGDDPINNTTTADNEAQPNWPFRLFFRAAASTEPPAHHNATPSDPIGTHFQSFFFPPTGVLRGAKLTIALGAGERADPTRFEDNGLDTDNNHYYVITDRDPVARSATAPDPLLDFLDEGDLADNGTLNSVSCNALQNGYDGYYLTGRDAEKFISNSAIFLGEVLTGSFIPVDPNGANACQAAGQGYLYRFGIDCGDGGYTTNPGGDDEERRRAIGAGLPTRPRVSVGGLNQGGGSTGCRNRVVVVTSDGSIENDCPGPLPSSGVNLHSWRERQ